MNSLSIRCVAFHFVIMLVGLVAATPVFAAAGWGASTIIMPHVHKYHTATVLRDGRVLIVGGEESDLHTASLYDPANDAWSETGVMPNRLVQHTATLLKDGRVLIAGGRRDVAGPSLSKKAFLYYPTTNSWETVQDLTIGRYGHTATLLPSGMVLIVGGVQNDLGGGTRTAELFDPVTKTWSQSFTIDLRIYPTATLLPNNKVLVAGGFATALEGALRTAEMYDIGMIPVSFTLLNLNQVYDGTPRPVGIGSSVSFGVDITYDGSATPPTDAGSYKVVAVANDPIYVGSVTGTLVVAKATATVTLNNLIQPYDGTPKTAGVTTSPASLPTTVTYNGLPTPPSAFGSYTVVATVDHRNYQGTATGILNISDGQTPQISSYSIPPTSASLSIPVTLTAVDNVGVAAYCLTETNNAATCAWLESSPLSYTFATQGSKFLTAFIRDRGGNLSPGVTASTLVDVTLPVINAFTVPETSTSLVLPVASFQASDNNAVSEYCITEINDSSVCAWTNIVPTQHVFASASPADKTVYAWVRDSVGNISLPAVRNVLIDVSRPNISIFTLPTASNSLTVSGINLVGADTVAVAGYCLTETNNSAGCTWTASSPTSHTFATSGDKLLFAFIKDTAGNISFPAIAPVSIETVLPTITSFVTPLFSTATLQISSFSATDNGQIDGYCLSTVNNPASCVWQSTPPGSYTFLATGFNTLFAWVKDAAGNISPPANRNITVTGTSYWVGILFSGTGGGMVNGDVSCSSAAACQPPLIAQGATVSLIPSPNIDSVFTGWSGDCSGTGNCNLAIDTIKIVTANFALAPLVKVQGQGATYASIMEAYKAPTTASGAIIQARVNSTPLLGDLLFDRDIQVSLVGGYDALYSALAGSTTIQGQMVVQSGSLFVAGISIR